MSTLSDIERLNQMLLNDPGLCQNMLEMGFIKLVPFVADHNGHLTSRYELTPYGEEEMLKRDHDCALFEAQEQRRG